MAEEPAIEIEASTVQVSALLNQIRPLVPAPMFDQLCSAIGVQRAKFIRRRTENAEMREEVARLRDELDQARSEAHDWRDRALEAEVRHEP